MKNLRQLWKGDDEVLVGVDPSGSVDAAAMHLRYVDDGTRLMTRVEVAAVCVTHRGDEPPYLGDEIMIVAQARACAQMARRGYDTAFIGGFIHVDNAASMRMAARHDWEPLEDPQLGGYVPWGREVC